MIVLIVILLLSSISLVLCQDSSQLHRREKCNYLWARFAPWSYSPDLCEFFITEHERQGVEDQWFSSFVYGFANFGLTIGERAPGLCFGPMDVKWGSYAKQVGCKRPDDLRNPYRNIRAHCLEVKVGKGRGYTDLELCKYIMFPARPHDWGGGRFSRTWRKMEKGLSEGYRAGKIQTVVVDPSTYTVVERD